MADHRHITDKIIAGGVTLFVALLLLLLLFAGGLRLERAELAAASVPEPEEEELYIEPEMLHTSAGDPDRQDAQIDDPAPAPAGQPEKAPEPVEEKVVKSDNPKPSKSTSEKLVTQKTTSPVKAEEPKKNTKEPSQIASKMGGKFSSKNGKEEGREGASGSGGTGEGVQGKLKGRSFLGCTLPKVRLKSKVTVVVSIEVDASGKVTGAKVSSGGGASSEILSKCVASARTARWSAKEGAAPARGSLTFTLVPKI